MRCPSPGGSWFAADCTPAGRPIGVPDKEAIDELAARLTAQGEEHAGHARPPGQVR